VSEVDVTARPTQTKGQAITLTVIRVPEATNTRRKTMKIMPVLRAAAMLPGAGVGSAYAGNGNGQSVSSPSTAIQAQLPSVSIGAPRTPPLFSIGGIQVRVWAPVAPPYNAEADGEFAARDIWGAGCAHFCRGEFPPMSALQSQPASVDPAYPRALAKTGCEQMRGHARLDFAA
jgi:hypothetical protein